MSTRILIVEDEEPIRQVTCQALEQKGFTCQTASNAADALVLIEREPFDIILSDVVMPGMNGLELIRHLRKNYPKILTVIMTGYAGQFNHQEAIQAGANDFIKKPFTMDELLARLGITLLHNEMHSLAITDDLTGLYNRRGFFTLAEHLLKLAKRNSTPLCLMYIDADDLKQINDRFGHAAGDAALVAFAELLKTNYRDCDVIARMGGDEFIVFPVGDSKCCQEVIESRLTDALAKLNASGMLAFPLTVSFGISLFDPSAPVSVEELITRADIAMYQHKKRKKSSL